MDITMNWTERDRKSKRMSGRDKKQKMACLEYKEENQGGKKIFLGICVGDFSSVFALVLHLN
jgi:hypothetical protein